MKAPYSVASSQSRSLAVSFATAPFSSLRIDQEVDDPDDAGRLQALELGQDLALEAAALEADGEHLHRAEDVRLTFHARSVRVTDWGCITPIG